MTREDQEQIAENVRAGAAAFRHALRVAADAGLRVDLDIRPNDGDGHMTVRETIWLPK